MTGRAQSLEVFNNREFIFFLSTRFFLTIALQVQAVIVGWQVFKIMQDPLSLGLIGLAEAIPAISIALYAGHIADVKSKRMIMVRSILLMLFCSIGLLVVTGDDFVIMFGGSNSVRCIYFFIFLSGLARGFYAPTGFSFLSQIVKREHLTTSSTWNSTVWQIAAIVGPALGGFLYAYFDITVTFGFIVGFTFLALISVFCIKSKPVIPQGENETIKERLIAGIKYVWNDKTILGALSLDLFAVLFGGAVALLPVFANNILHVGAEGLGMLRAAPSLGASLTMIWMSFRKPVAQPGKVLLACVAAFGLCMIGFGLSTSFYLSLFLLFMSGGFDSISVITRSNILQLRTPDHMRGRVSSVNTIFIGSSNEIGAFESGLAAKLMGTVPSVVFGGCMTLLVVAYTNWKGKALKFFHY